MYEYIERTVRSFSIFEDALTLSASASTLIHFGAGPCLGVSQNTLKINTGPRQKLTELFVPLCQSPKLNCMLTMSQNTLGQHMCKWYLGSEEWRCALTTCLRHRMADILQKATNDSCLNRTYYRFRVVSWRLAVGQSMVTELCMESALFLGVLVTLWSF